MKRAITTFLVLAIAAGCSNAKQGAVSGAAIGALSGLAIGSLTGSAGKGAAIGAVVGGVGGAVIGDQNRRKEEAAAAQQQQQMPPSPPPAQTATAVHAPPGSVVVISPGANYATGPTLGRLVGNWNVAGTIDGGSIGPVLVSGTAKGVVDKTYFVRLDCKYNDPRTNDTVEGTSIISQSGGRGLESTNSFSTSPQIKRFRGEMDASGSVITLNQIEPAPVDRRIIIRFAAGAGFTAEVWDGDKKVESYTFTPA